MGPLKKFLKFESLNEEGKKLTEKMKKKIEICQTLLDDDEMYIPFSACLISKFPFVQQSEKCLQSFTEMFFDKKFSDNDIYNYIFYLVNSIIIPPPEKTLNFFIPFSKKVLQIYNQKIMDLPIINNCLWRIFEFLNIDNIITVFHLILLEQKILFVANEHLKLADVIEAFINLIYPFQY